jgi:DmsE family decaheme c-type cytochrome
MLKTRMTTRETVSAFLIFIAALSAIVFAAQALAVPDDEELTFEEGPKPVIFSGKVHADHGLKCNECHNSIFKKEKGNAKMSFDDHAEGSKFCFACHNGTKSFAATKGSCAKCHGNKSSLAAPVTPAAVAVATETAKAPAPAAVKEDAAKATTPVAAKQGAPKAATTAADKEAAVEKLKQATFSKDGANTCIGCHDEDNEYPIFPMFKTKHAVKADPRSPFGGTNQQCESCHGAGSMHIKAKKNEKRGGSILNFGKNAWTPVKDQNEKCLSCHQTHQRIDWKGSSHEFSEVACASCHKIHVAKDPVLDRREQPRVCFECHTKERAKFHQVSRHPVWEGQMSCNECHNVHGEKGTGALVKASSREKCTSCHAEKRGPFLWEHAPAAEDCTICHVPHGSNQPALLKKRAPLLCQECHSPTQLNAAHASGRYDGSKPLSSIYLGVKSCLNCHSQVHGANHPSGANHLR